MLVGLAGFSSAKVVSSISMHFHLSWGTRQHLIAEKLMDPLLICC